MQKITMNEPYLREIPNRQIEQVDKKTDIFLRDVCYDYHTIPKPSKPWMLMVDANAWIMVLAEVNKRNISKN